jgi:hypothetical protein
MVARFLYIVETKIVHAVMTRPDDAEQIRGKRPTCSC